MERQRISEKVGEQVREGPAAKVRSPVSRLPGLVLGPGRMVKVKRSFVNMKEKDTTLFPMEGDFNEINEFDFFVGSINQSNEKWVIEKDRAFMISSCITMWSTCFPNAAFASLIVGIRTTAV